MKIEGFGLALVGALCCLLLFWGVSTLQNKPDESFKERCAASEGHVYKEGLRNQLCLTKDGRVIEL